MDCCEDPMAMCRVVCPKPRRVSPPKLINTVTSLAPSRFHIRNDAESSNDGVELLGLIFRQDPSWSGGPFLLGSPPCRSQNPVVQDADFGVDNRLTES
ncbi:hypothetical protein C2S53_007085 [Perilla frutescens var. hirtella]|uniref:Uncharacterized protein n=1 Tax=Perilla frutescens var. hirtella TaxID=608512 RepID=A0AAD4INR3_PERFH|nr:hypothetical protein C2S53_007085 [Perilla frutescens var. hirtella]KAH6759980.1 hypothetical protein C2S51_016929 [Perilla frutescens var. frutescens]